MLTSFPIIYTKIYYDEPTIELVQETTRKEMFLKEAIFLAVECEFYISRVLPTQKFWTYIEWRKALTIQH